MKFISRKNFLDTVGWRFRLYLSLLIALLVYLLSRYHSAPIVFMLVWISFAGSSLLFSWITIFSSHPQGLKKIVKEQDTGRSLIFLFVVSAAFISLFAVIFLLQDIPNGSKRGLTYHVLLAGAAVVCSWFLIHTLFTLRYAHLYYTDLAPDADAKSNERGGLDFPNSTFPDYLDFAYFAFVLGMTFQVSDVQITSRSMRRLALLHGLLSFVYNTVIVALSINIISGVISK